MSCWMCEYTTWPLPPVWANHSDFDGIDEKVGTEFITRGCLVQVWQCH